MADENDTVYTVAAGRPHSRPVFVRPFASQVSRVNPWPSKNEKQTSARGNREGGRGDKNWWGPPHWHSPLHLLRRGHGPSLSHPSGHSYPSDRRASISGGHAGWIYCRESCTMINGPAAAARPVDATRRTRGLLPPISVRTCADIANIRRVARREIIDITVTHAVVFNSRTHVSAAIEIRPRHCLRPYTSTCRTTVDFHNDDYCRNVSRDVSTATDIENNDNSDKKQFLFFNFSNYARPRAYDKPRGSGYSRAEEWRDRVFM